MSNVVQEWVNVLTWKEQTVLFCAIRGTDSFGSKDLKLITRWIRSIVLNNAAPNKTFMKETNFRDINIIADENPLVFDMIPVHYFGHLLHALEIIGYEHPSDNIKIKSITAYNNLCTYLHLNPESKIEMMARLKDEIIMNEV